MMITRIIPPDRIKHSEWKEMSALKGRILKNADRKYLMRRKLRAKRGRARYKLRQISIEPVFGHVNFSHKLLADSLRTECREINAHGYTSTKKYRGYYDSAAGIITEFPEFVYPEDIKEHIASLQELCPTKTIVLCGSNFSIYIKPILSFKYISYKIIVLEQQISLLGF